MSHRTCAADDCKARFEPYSIDQVYCSHRCGTRMRVRLCRQRKRYGGDGGGGGKQRRLFPKPMLIKAKPPKAAPVAEPNLFEGDLLASFGGAVEYGPYGSASDKNMYSVKSGSRKPSTGVRIAGEPHAA